MLKNNTLLLIFLLSASLFAARLLRANSADSQLFLPFLATERAFEANPLPHSFNFVTDVVNAGDARLFVAERAGLIKVVQADGTLSTFLDIQSQVKSDEGETGLYGIAFHPDYANNGYFYVSYFGTERGDGLYVTRFSVSADENVADPTSAAIQLMISMEAFFHNGGALRFNKDGYLYLGVGDDHNSGHAQTESLKGKLLRLDVDGEGVSFEIWARGLRNPWRIGVDPVTGDIFIGDVGDRKFEEVNFLPFGVRNLNYGWPCYEGSEGQSGCGNPDHFTPSIYEYDHTMGCSVTGGEVVYKGSERVYLFADLCRRTIQSLRFMDGAWQVALEGTLPEEAGILLTFGRNHTGTIFAGAEQTVFELYLPR